MVRLVSFYGLRCNSSSFFGCYFFYYLRINNRVFSNSFYSFFSSFFYNFFHCGRSKFFFHYCRNEFFFFYHYGYNRLFCNCLYNWRCNSCSLSIFLHCSFQFPKIVFNVFHLFDEIILFIYSPINFTH